MNASGFHFSPTIYIRFTATFSLSSWNAWRLDFVRSSMEKMQILWLKYRVIKRVFEREVSTPKPKAMILDRGGGVCLSVNPLFRVVLPFRWIQREREIWSFVRWFGHKFFSQFSWRILSLYISLRFSFLPKLIQIHNETFFVGNQHFVWDRLSKQWSRF